MMNRLAFLLQTHLPMRTIAAFLLLAASPALGLEVSIEENRAERGSIGYVDLHKVFQLFPQTHKAKQSFAEIVRQAEEQVNLRKGELIGLRSELSRLTLELELLQKTPIPVPQLPPSPSAEVVPSTTGAPRRWPAEVSTRQGRGPSPSICPGDHLAHLVQCRRCRRRRPPSPGGARTAAPTTAPIAVRSGALRRVCRQARRARCWARSGYPTKELAAKRRVTSISGSRRPEPIWGKRTEMLLGKIYLVVKGRPESRVSVVVDRADLCPGRGPDRPGQKTGGPQP